jgi:2-oxo-4-hydroxy-4-carboxy-5-ureidoimidazoline decarboxylase
MTTVVETATKADQLALLQAHPDLGTRARVSDVSSAEQQGAGLDRLDAAEFARVQELNANYRARFGFPFLFAVKGSTKHDVLAALETRIAMTQAAEFDEALRQVYKIARFRLEEVCGTTG